MKLNFSTKNNATTVACAGLFMMCTYSPVLLAQVANPGFEDGFDGWVEVDPAAVSEDARTGQQSGKITGSGGELSQVISIQPDTVYTLSAFVQGDGEVGVSVNGNDMSTEVSSGSSWDRAEISFNSGSSTQATVFARYNGDTARFDDFELTQLDMDPPDEESIDDDGIIVTAQCSGNNGLPLRAASDIGGNDGNVPENTIDGDLSTRWSSEGDGKSLVVDLDAIAMVDSVEVAWYKGDQRSAFFDIQTSLDQQNWETVLDGGASFRDSGFETYSLAESNARFVRVVGHENTDNSWNSVLEIQVNGCVLDENVPPGTPPITTPGPTDLPTPEPGPTPDPTPEPPTVLPIDELDPNAEPWENFDLTDWQLNTPNEDDRGLSAETQDIDFVNGELYPGSEPFFFTGSDGGLVFRSTVDGFRTSNNTSYVRSELREMLRRGDLSVERNGVTRNNWVFSSNTQQDRAQAGAVDGVLTGTLAINRVTTTGDSGQVGRVIFAQIHANDDEPLRLYYRKLPENELGSIYFAHEDRHVDDDIYVNMVGSRDSDQSNPSDGVALDEVFSYEIVAEGNDLQVTLIRDGKSDIVREFDMSDSGYDDSGQYMYFKLGAYGQDNTGDGDDFSQVTYYEFDNQH